MFFLLLIFSAVSAKSQPPELIMKPEFRTDAGAAVDSIYNFNFSAADRHLRPWMQKYPGHPLWQLMEGIKLWWQILSDLEDTSHDKQFIHIMKKADYEASRLLQKNRSHLDALLIKAISNGYVARQYANRDEWIQSVNEARKALNAYEYLLELDTGMDDLKLAEGMKLYYSAYLPEAYPIIKTVSWFFPDGNKEKGLQLMEEAAHKAIFVRAEASYFLGNIHYNYEKEYEKALEKFSDLYHAYPHNNYYARLYVRVLFKLKKYEKSSGVIEEAVMRWEKENLPLKEVLNEELFMWQGRIFMKNQHTDQAIKAFKKSFETGKKLPMEENRSFHVISGYYAGKLLFDRQEYKAAKYYLEKVKSLEAEPEYRNRAEELIRDMPSE